MKRIATLMLIALLAFGKFSSLSNHCRHVVADQGDDAGDDSGDDEGSDSGT
jgi:hypothetical protein